MNLLVVKIADYRSPETRVLERLLAPPHPDIRATALCHAEAQHRGHVEAFGHATGADARHIDFGWRGYCRQPGMQWQKAACWFRFWFAAMPLAVFIAFRARPGIVLSSQQRWDCLAAWLLVLAGLGRRRQVIHLHYTPGPGSVGWRCGVSGEARS
ncbi:MAG: hypothetical protein U5Q44_02390 [Dehalococcoidia bacterium]|nr:hypothetical protein [Dehalococcoidia bacterium]